MSHPDSLAPGPRSMTSAPPPRKGQCPPPRDRLTPEPLVSGWPPQRSRRSPQPPQFPADPVRKFPPELGPRVRYRQPPDPDEDLADRLHLGATARASFQVG